MALGAIDAVILVILRMGHVPTPNSETSLRSWDPIKTQLLAAGVNPCSLIAFRLYQWHARDNGHSRTELFMDPTAITPSDPRPVRALGVWHGGVGGLESIWRGICDLTLIGASAFIP